MNPIATFCMASGARIVVELLPEAAPNTVNSFIYCIAKIDLNSLRNDAKHSKRKKPPGLRVAF